VEVCGLLLFSKLSEVLKSVILDCRKVQGEARGRSQLQARIFIYDTMHLVTDWSFIFIVVILSLMRMALPLLLTGGVSAALSHARSIASVSLILLDTWRRNKDNDDDDDDDDDEEEEEESEEEESEEEPAPTASASAPKKAELTREERRAQKKQAKTKATGTIEEEEDEDPLLANPNHSGMKMLKLSEVSAPRELSRRERYVSFLCYLESHQTSELGYREEKEKKEAKERFHKLQAQGKTDQSRKDLERLAKIRAEREAAAAKRKAEAEGM
jgi:hypothetical protein